MYQEAMESAIHSQMVDAWRTYLDSLHESMDQLNKELDEAAEMREICTDEWCVATEHMIDDLANAVFAISEPRWTSEEDSRKLKELKRRIHDLYAKRKGVVERRA